MARITWQNVTAPDLSTSRAALQQAGNSLSSGFQGFADSFKDIEQQQKDAYSQEALARLAQVSDPNQLNSMMANGGLASLGIEDPRYLNADAMQSILGRPKTLFDNQNTAASTASTEATRLQTLFDTFSAQQEFPTKQAKAAADLEETKQNIRIAENKAPVDLANIRSQIAERENTSTVLKAQENRLSEAQKTRLAQEERELKQLKLEETKIIESNRIDSQIAAFTTVEDARKNWSTFQTAIKNNPQNYNQAIIDKINLGPEAALENRLAAEQTYNAGVSKTATEAAVKEFYNDPSKLGWNKNAFKEHAQRVFPEGSQELKDALAFIDLQPVRAINSDFAAEIANDPALSAGAQYLDQQQIQLEGKKLANPLYNASQIIDGKDSAFKGTYTKLTDKLSGEDNVLWGINNAKVANFLVDFANKAENKNVPKDVIAMVILNGHAIDPRGAFERAVPLRKDFTLNEKAIKAEVDAIMSAFDPANSDRLDSLLTLRAEEDRLKSQTDRFNQLLERGGRQATGTSEYNQAARNQIVGQLILDAEALLGRRLRPDEATKIIEDAISDYIPQPPENELQNLNIRGRNRLRNSNN